MEQSNMAEFLAREYLPVIKNFPEREAQEMLLRESIVTLVRVKDPSKKLKEPVKAETVSLRLFSVAVAPDVVAGFSWLPCQSGSIGATGVSVDWTHIVVWTQVQSLV